MAVGVGVVVVVTEAIGLNETTGVEGNNDAAVVAMSF